MSPGRLTLTVEEAGALLGISRAFAYEAVPSHRAADRASELRNCRPAEAPRPGCGDRLLSHPRSRIEHMFAGFEHSTGPAPTVALAQPDRHFVDSPGCPLRVSDPTGAVVATEASVRSALRDQALSGVDHPTEALYEFWVPLSNERADLVVVGKAMNGYEIKTERDTLRRLPRQAAAYGRVFDTCSIVTAERHFDAAFDLVPEWWGVIAYVNHDQLLAFREVRSASPNHGVDPETLVRLLWREEVRAALVSIGTEPDPRASRGSMWQHLLNLIDLGHLREIVRAAILRRDSSTARLSTRRFSSAGITS